MTMNCENCRERLDDLLDGELSDFEEAKCLQHIEQCEECNRLYALAQNIRNELVSMPVPEMRTAFPAEALNRVEQHYRSSHRQGYVMGFATAVAASIALWFAVTLFSPPVTTPGNGGVPAISMNVGQVQQVNLVFNSPEHIKRATFTLLLPDSTELEGYPGRRELTWTGSLRKGKNRLSLPLRTNTEKPGEVVARISDGKAVKVFRLKLDVKANVSDSSHYQQV